MESKVRLMGTNSNNSININFEDTSVAFASYTNHDLRKMQGLFRVMNYSWLVNILISLGKLALNLNIPFAKTMMRATIFNQFVGGEDLGQVSTVVKQLDNYNVSVILDYGAEAKSHDDEIDAVITEIIKSIRFAANHESVPAVSMKISGLADNAFLARINNDYEQFKNDPEFLKLYSRLDNICSEAAAHKVSVLIDGEESWIQVTIDNLVIEMMKKYNTSDYIIFNTYQLYRHDKLAQLISDHEVALKSGYYFAAKIVRGAYLDKEASYSEEQGIPTVINPNKETTDSEFNKAAEYCLKNHRTLSVVVATHNKISTEKACHYIKEHGITPDTKNIAFSQLYGMSDPLTYNLAHHGFTVAKYLPYGPLKEVFLYLTRRAKENTSVTGEVSRELTKINGELMRRKMSCKR